VHAPNTEGIAKPVEARSVTTRWGIGGNQIVLLAGASVALPFEYQAATAFPPDPGYCLPASAGTSAPTIVVADPYRPLSVAWLSPTLAQVVDTEVVRPGPANASGVDGVLLPHALYNDLGSARAVRSPPFTASAATDLDFATRLARVTPIPNSKIGNTTKMLTTTNTMHSTSREPSSRTAIGLWSPRFITSPRQPAVGTKQRRRREPEP
jgi:hypothetical protein